MPTSIHHCLCAIRHLETKFSQIFLGNIFASYVTNCYSNCHFVLYSRRKKSPYSELFWSAFSPDFPAFGLNTERYGISPYSVRMRENPGKMRTRITPNRNSFNGLYFCKFSYKIFLICNFSCHIDM